MKPRRDVVPLLNGKNVVSLNLMRLRGRIRQIDKTTLSLPRFTQQEHKRRMAIRARTGGFCRG